MNPHEISAAVRTAVLYGAVLTAYLAKSGAVGDVETKVAYLTELAHHLYETKVDHLPDEAAVAWHNDYCRRRLVRCWITPSSSPTWAPQVLLVRDGEVSFRYNAGFYYFVALHMFENLASQPSATR